AATRTRHAGPAMPARWIVHDPHCATPHPYLVPVSPTCSRIAHSRGVLGSKGSSMDLPLLVKRAMFPSPVAVLGMLWGRSRLMSLLGSSLAQGHPCHNRRP